MSIAFTALSLFWAASSADGFVIINLRGGQMIRGEVLKERDDSIVVDVGVDVIVVSKAEITSRGPEEKSAKSGSTSAKSFGQSAHLYATADLPVSPIKELVN